MKYILIPIYLLLTTSGLVLMKLGANPGTLSLKNGVISASMSSISALGFICYICSFLLFTRLVVMFDLSWIYPLTAGIVQVLTLLASYFVFKEKISVYGLVGTIFVIIGIVIMNIKIPSNNEKVEQIADKAIVSNNKV